MEGSMTENSHPAGDSRPADPAEAVPNAGGEGDFRGPYGYGRKAHGSDPLASYAFDRKPHPLPPPGAPSTPPPALEQRPAVSEAEDVEQDRTVFRG
jgi:hypothetical protein